MPPKPDPDEEEAERVRRNEETWDEQKDWTVTEAPEIAWETKMRTVVDTFKDSVSFESATVVLQPSGFQFNVDVASTPEQRAAGMTGREFSAETPAMLFTLPEGVAAQFRSNAAPDLVIAFFDEEGTMMSHNSLAASAETKTVDAVGARYVLEFDPARLPLEQFDGQTIEITTSM